MDCTAGEAGIEQDWACQLTATCPEIIEQPADMSSNSNLKPLPSGDLQFASKATSLVRMEDRANSMR